MGWNLSKSCYSRVSYFYFILCFVFLTLCPSNPTGASDTTVVPNSSPVALVPSGVFCFHLGGSAHSRLLAQQPLESWERVLGCESSSLMENSESWWSNVQQTEESWKWRTFRLVTCGRSQMRQRSEASTQAFLDKAGLNLRQENPKMSNKRMCDEN